jgi:hypothetical protein
VFNKEIRLPFKATAILLFFSLFASAQRTVEIKDLSPHHIFSYGEVEYLEDKSTKLTFQDVLKPSFNQLFRQSNTFTRKNLNSPSAYWYKFSIRHSSDSKKRWILEFFDQTIDQIQLYVPDKKNVYHVHQYGNQYPFSKRTYQHKNFIFDLPNDSDQTKTYYLRIKSSQYISVIVVLRDVKWFMEYALIEYLMYGLFYGMVIIFSLYNLLMFAAVKRRAYLFYVMYNLSIGFYEMCCDGIAFQFLWPQNPLFNHYAYGIALFSSSIFGLLFTLYFLMIPKRSPMLYRIIVAAIGIRTLFFIVCLVHPSFFAYKIVDFIPLLLAFYSGCYSLKKGYKPARFFVVGYSFLVVGVILKILLLLNINWLPYGPLTHYSLSFCFVMEMILVSFAIGDNIRYLRKRKDEVQKRIIKQMLINQQLDNDLKRNLNILVEQRTQELDQKNEQLSSMNSLLIIQSKKIFEMNQLLKNDNTELSVSIEKITRSRVMSEEVDFAEFCKIYPDRETCFKYLSEIKWKNGYTCRKCNNKTYLTGNLPYSRRCTRCRYDESVIACTLFQNSRIPINKAFYMLFMIYSTNGKISSHKLSEILSIRQSTCWVYSSKMKKALQERKKELKNAGEKGWIKLVFELEPD